LLSASAKLASDPERAGSYKSFRLAVILNALLLLRLCIFPIGSNTVFDEDNFISSFLLYLTACIIGALLVSSCIKAYTHTQKAGRVLLILGIASSVVNFFSGIYYFIPYCLLLDNFELFAPLSDSFINPYSILFSASAYKENMTFLYIATAPFMLAFLFRAAAMMFPARQMSGAAAPAEFAIETLPEESRPAEPVPEESRPAEPVPVEPYLTKPNKGIYIMHEHYMEYLPVVPPVVSTPPHNAQ